MLNGFSSVLSFFNLLSVYCGYNPLYTPNEGNSLRRADQKDPCIIRDYLKHRHNLKLYYFSPPTDPPLKTYFKTVILLPTQSINF
jgi:hypothetical protein